MFLSDLFEGRQAPLYHTMDYDKAMDVFEHDIMPARWEHKIPGGNIVKGNSFTRNKNLRHGNTVFLIINQQAITNNKIIPLDGEYVWSKSLSGGPLPYNRQDRLRHNAAWADKSDQDRHETLSEEFVVGDIKNLHRIITKIYLFDSGRIVLGPTKAYNLHGMTKAYSKKFNLPFDMSEKFKRMVDQFLEWQEYDDD